MDPEIPPTTRYLSATQLSNLHTADLPHPDAYIGKTRGWLDSTIENQQPSTSAPIHYLSLQGFADHIGKHRGTLVRAKLPPPDAYIGKTRGWLPETIDAWMERRPGRGSKDPSWYLPDNLKHLAPPQRPRGWTGQLAKQAERAEHPDTPKQESA